MNGPTSGITTAKSLRRWFVNGFIVLNLVTILFSSTEPLAKQNLLQRAIFPYALWTRLLQSWALFTPSPRHNAMKYRVEVTFKNRQTTTWQRPYPPNWDFFERHLAYNFQKWDLASDYLEHASGLWTDLALFVQRMYWNDLNPPITIRLIRSMAPWPPPHETGYVMHNDSELRWNDYVLFTYDVFKKRME